MSFCSFVLYKHLSSCNQNKTSILSISLPVVRWCQRATYILNWINNGLCCRNPVKFMNKCVGVQSVRDVSMMCQWLL